MADYVLDCSGLSICYNFVHPETHNLFGSYLKAGQNDKVNHQISVNPGYMEEYRWLVDEKEKSKAFLEFQSLMIATGNFLLEHDRALFHGASILWKEKAWIITAPSGTGKTTQLRLWKRLLKASADIINGDKPLLECRNDGSVWVSSSPWRGKERYGRPGLCAPLGGIILLEQGDENQIVRMSPEEAVIPLFIEFISYPENTEQITHQAAILNHILLCVPVWKLVNLGDENSARLTIETLEQHLETIG